MWAEGGERELVPIHGPEKDHPRGQRRYQNHDSTDRHHALCFRHALDAKRRDEAPHTNCGDGTDDDEGEDNAKGEVHKTFAMRYYPCARCSYERGAEGTGR